MKNIIFPTKLFFALICACITLTSTAEVYTLIPDSKFEDKLISLSIDTDGKNGKVLQSRVSGLTHLDVSNCGINDLTGIEDFISLTYLNCGTNNLSSIDVSKNTSLHTFACYGNDLTHLDVSKNLALASLGCEFNDLTELNVSKNTALLRLDFDSNKLTDIDLSANTELTTLLCSSNYLNYLDVSNNTKLSGMSCTKNPNLASICVHDMQTALALFDKDASASWTTCKLTTSVDTEETIALSIFPNPSNGNFRICTQHNAQVLIYDAMGKEIMNTTISVGSTDLKTLTLPGIYLLTLIYDNNHSTQKIIIE